MWEQILPGLRIKIFMTVVLGVAYPLAVTAISQAVYPARADGSLVRVGGKLVGSELIGQSFSKPEYFHPRPSSAGTGYDATASSGSNLGPTSAKLLRGTTRMDDKTRTEVVDFDGVALRVVRYCVENGIPYESSAPLDSFKDAKGDLDDVKLIKAFSDDKSPLVFTPKSPIPADAVTGSASGLDPNISPANASAQAARVAKARGVTAEQVAAVVAQNTARPTWGILGEPRVNVLTLNIALDRRFPVSR